MKKILIGSCFLFFLALTTPSCSPKYGCEINDTHGSSMDNAKGGNTNLFPKHMRKKRG
ncbi:MAG: hypothetical protein KDC34_11655 [Saprospiraceae bacterium]|nr:hypothetical protein [Saprospiraceae bacterium]